MNAKRAGLGLLAVVALGSAAFWAFRPADVLVDLAVASVAPMQVTVAAEGVVRVRDPYAVMAPLAGVVARSPVQVGDRVIKDQTVIAVIAPSAPAILDARTRLQAEAAVAEAEAGLQMAQARLAQAVTELAHAESAYGRSTALADQGLIPLDLLEDAATAQDNARAGHVAALSAVAMQRATLGRMQAQLQGPVDLAGEVSGCCYEVKAPLSGTVLALESQSARPVQAGAPLLSIGDLADLEVEVDLLSTDAVQIAVGAAATVERWGGEGVLDAVVRRIEPSAYTKISALGIEEQRVKVRLDLLTPPEGRVGLGDQFRVFVRVVIWDGGSVLQVPIGALFRSGDAWALYREVDGRARRSLVTLGRQTDLDVQIVSGLTENDRVVVFPGDKVQEGTRLAERPQP